MVAETNEIGGNGAITKSEPATTVLRDANGRWLPGTTDPAHGRHRDPAEAMCSVDRAARRLESRIFDAIAGLTGDLSIEGMLKRVAKEKPTELMKLVCTLAAPETGKKSDRTQGTFSLDELLTDLDHRHERMAERDATLIDPDVVGEPESPGAAEGGGGVRLTRGGDPMLLESHRGPCSVFPSPSEIRSGVPRVYPGPYPKRAPESRARFFFRYTPGVIRHWLSEWVTVLPVRFRNYFRTLLPFGNDFPNGLPGALSMARPSSPSGGR